MGLVSTATVAASGPHRTRVSVLRRLVILRSVRQPIDFIEISPANYMVRVIYDENKNSKYDTGNYLKKIQPERVSYYPTLLDIRSGWDYVETFILK